MKHYKISRTAKSNIRNFYRNVSKKYVHTYSIQMMKDNVTNAINSIYKIENGLQRREPTISRWSDYFMAHDGKWYFAYRIVGDTIYVEDACHSQNMHEHFIINSFYPMLSIINSINYIRFI